MANGIVNLLDLDVQHTNSITAQFRTQSINLTLNTIRFKLRSNYMVDEKLQEIYAALRINNVEIVRIPVEGEDIYSFPCNIELSANTTYSLTFSFYRSDGSTSASAFTYYDTVTTKEFPEAQIMITSNQFYCCEMFVTYMSLWDFSANGYPCPYGLQGNDLWYEFSEPKRWDLWKVDTLVNDGYPYIFDFISKLKTIDIFRFNGETKQWVRVIPSYYDKQKNLRLMQVYKIRKE